MKKYFYFILLIMSFACSTKKDISKSKLKLDEYHKHGYLDDRGLLDSIIFAHTGMNIDPNKPLIIIYYPGKDPCNSSGSSTRMSTEKWYNEMERGIKRIQPSNVMYVFKDSMGLYGRNDGFKEWYKDPKRLIERRFFQKDPKCGGFTIISKNGEYLSVLTEFSKEAVWRDLKYLKKSSK
jgi:hypothetical protein